MLRHRRNQMAAAFATLALIGCGGGGGEAGGGDAAPAASAAAPAAVTNPATLNIAVNFTGTAPAPQAIDMSDEKVCADKHTGGAKTEDVMVANGKLQNVFVYVKEGLPAGAHPAPGEAVTIDQNGCVYIPRVVGAVAGQNIVFRNSDGILHNIKAVPTTNRPFNISQPSNGDTQPRQFTSAEVMVPIECNVHGWMKGYVGVLEHPYFGVSAADGAARIANLPAGTYTIEAWHEKYGVQTQSVTVADNETKEVTFNFSAATATRVPLGPALVVPSATAAGGHVSGR